MPSAGHVVRIGIEFVDDGGYDVELDGVVDGRHLDEGRVDGECLFERAGHVVGEYHELGIRQILQVDHLTICIQSLVHGLLLFTIPFGLGRAAQCRRREGEKRKVE